MKMKRLGRTSIDVSELCLGSMTWGTQNTADEAHDQIDRALDAGINFIDTAEMYPVNPVSEETIGRTERVIGLWFDRDMRRDEVVLATKHSGEGLAAVRDGAPISSETIAETVEGSLRRLKTDYIDLYQFHWPNRGSYMFRKNWGYDPSGQLMIDTAHHMEDALEALQKEVKRGTIRAFGLSNESAWGTMKWIEMAERTGGPRVASVQNEYSLLCRLYDTDMSEVSVEEDVPLLAFSPLAAGLLTGKYQDGAVPSGSRMTLSPELGGRKTANAFSAVAAYVDIAERPVVLTKWCPPPGPGAADQTLSEDVLAEIDKAHRLHPMPY